METYCSMFLVNLIWCLQFVKICPKISMDTHGNAEIDFTTNAQISPCRYANDPNYISGTLVDCSNLGLTTIDPTWFPLSTTTIDLDNNSLIRLSDTFFQFNRKLRRLNINQNRLAYIDVKTFQDLKNLRVLNLENNRLNLGTGGLDTLIFRNLSALVELRLGHNANAKNVGPYPNGLLRGLANLTILSLDTFSGPLRFDRLLEDLISLKALFLTGAMTSIKKESFVGFKHISLESLSLMHVYQFQFTESNAFHYLDKLTNLSMSHGEQGVRDTFLSLSPFQGRNMTSLKFDEITSKSNVPKAISDSSIVTKDMAKYLSKICVKHFTLIHSRVFYMDLGVFFSPLWQKCLKTLDLRGNPLIGDMLNFLMVGEMKRLTSLRLNDCRVNAFGGSPYSRSSLQSINVMNDNRKYTSTNHNRNLSFLASPPNEMGSQDDSLKMSSSEYNFTNDLMFKEAEFLNSKPRYSKLIVNVPPNLQRFEYAACGYKNGGSFYEYSIELVHAVNVKYVDISDNGFQNFLLPLQGLTNVYYFDFSYNDGTVLSSSFMNSLYSVGHLRMAGMNLNNSQTPFKSNSPFRNLTKLEHIDLSANEFSLIEASTFKDNLQLKSMNLSKNKFRSIPIDILNFLPNFQTLDMTYNSIVSFSPRTMSILDEQVKKVPSFSVLLTGNLLSCGCSEFKLIVWLKHTRVSLDQGRDYPCIDQNGNLTSTSNQINNIETLWRKCVGEKVFYIAVILLSMLMLCFIVCYILFHFQTFIITGILRLFTNKFNLKSPKDYRYGVFLGYPNQDYRFACHSLRKFIEDSLKFTTYVRDRDLLPATDMAESIVEATNSSWRVLLLATESFLERDEWCYFTLKISTYCADPLNPNRIILLVERGFLESIPRSLLKVVPEDNILIMERPFLLGPDERDFLSNAIDYKVK